MLESVLKKKLRELKKQEVMIRGTRPNAIWDSYFSVRGRYALRTLLAMTDAERKTVIEDFFMSVYLMHYREIGQPISDLYDPALLSIFGLNGFATLADVKTRFRALAQRHHPDKGGDPEVFRMYLEAYEQIKNN